MLPLLLLLLLLPAGCIERVRPAVVEHICCLRVDHRGRSGAGGLRRGASAAAATGSGFTVRQLVLLLPLHSSVLEPDLDLTFGEAERMRDLDPASTRQVAVEVELFLELEDLVLRVGGARPLAVDQTTLVAVGGSCCR